jgi:hypothetical protein
MEPRHLDKILITTPKMNRFHVLAFLAVCVPALRASAVDLTPRFVDTFVDGVTTHRLYFADGDQKIGLSINRETTVEAGAGGTVFRFPKFSDILFILKHSPMSADQAFEGVTLERYREAARRLLPPGAQNIQALGEEPDPITINSWRSYRFTYSCESTGSLRKQTITFLNISAEEQLVLIVTAIEQNFPEAAARSWQIIRSWQPILPGQEKSPKGT